jgi:hypothetical protein
MHSPEQSTNQSAQWAGITGDELRKLTQEIREAFSSRVLSHEHRQNVDAHVGTLEAQTQATKPNHLIVRESLKSLRTIAEESGAALIAAKIAEILGLAAL